MKSRTPVLTVLACWLAINTPACASLAEVVTAVPPAAVSSEEAPAPLADSLFIPMKGTLRGFIDELHWQSRDSLEARMAALDKSVEDGRADFFIALLCDPDKTKRPTDQATELDQAVETGKEKENVEFLKTLVLSPEIKALEDKGFKNKESRTARSIQGSREKAFFCLLDLGAFGAIRDLLTAHKQAPLLTDECIFKAYTWLLYHCKSENTEPFHELLPQLKLQQQDVDCAFSQFIKGKKNEAVLGMLNVHIGKQKAWISEHVIHQAFYVSVTQKNLELASCLFTYLPTRKQQSHLKKIKALAKREGKVIPQYFKEDRFSPDFFAPYLETELQIRPYQERDLATPPRQNMIRTLTAHMSHTATADGQQLLSFDTVKAALNAYIDAHIQESIHGKQRVEDNQPIAEEPTESSLAKGKEEEANEVVDERLVRRAAKLKKRAEMAFYYHFQNGAKEASGKPDHEYETFMQILVSFLMRVDPENGLKIWADGFLEESGEIYIDDNHKEEYVVCKQGYQKRAIMALNRLPQMLQFFAKAEAEPYVHFYIHCWNPTRNPSDVARRLMEWGLKSSQSADEAINLFYTRIRQNIEQFKIITAPKMTNAKTMDEARLDLEKEGQPFDLRQFDDALDTIADGISSNYPAISQIMADFEAEPYRARCRQITSNVATGIAGTTVFSSLVLAGAYLFGFL